MIPARNIKENIDNLKSGKYKAIDLVNYFLNRIDKFDKNVNSFITITKDYAYQKARDIDKLLIENKNNPEERFPLFGTVIALKDLFLTKGIRTTAASNVLREYIPSYSAKGV